MATLEGLYISVPYLLDEDTGSTDKLCDLSKATDQIGTVLD